VILLYSSWIKDLTVSGAAWPFCLVIFRSMPGRGANSVFYGGGGMIFIISNFICNRVRHRQNFSLKLNPTSHHLTQALDRKMSPFLKCPELKTLEWWISGLRRNPLFFLISRLNIAWLMHDFKLQINYSTGYLDISF